MAKKRKKKPVTKKKKKVVIKKKAVLKKKRRVVGKKKAPTKKARRRAPKKKVAKKAGRMVSALVRANMRRAKSQAGRIAKQAIHEVAPAASVAEPAPPPPPPAVELHEGDLAPDFRAQTDNDEQYSLSGFRGRKIVLYFYPKDDTPGCTKEACYFRDGIAKIHEKGAIVLGVSVDSPESHRAFKEKYNLNFPLLSDVDKKIVQDYGVWKLRSMYGRTFMGIERTTFLIDEAGRIQKIFPKVDVEIHYDEVLKALG